jgi:hypothetical protein
MPKSPAYRRRVAKKSPYPKIRFTHKKSPKRSRAGRSRSRSRSRSRGKGDMLSLGSPWVRGLGAAAAGGGAGFVGGYKKCISDVKSKYSPDKAGEFEKWLNSPSRFRFWQKSPPFPDENTYQKSAGFPA